MTEITSVSSFVIESRPRLVKGDIRDTPQRAGTIKETPSSGDLGLGLTDRLYLIGHADGLEINDPYQVANVQDLINILGADTDSPLLRGFFDVYNEGARDIWLVAAAPMDEYIADQSDRNVAYDHLGDQTFYETYYDRLTTTYSILRDFTEPEIIVPLEAPMYYTAGVDFLTQLSDHCQDAIAWTGTVRLGFIGTRITDQSSSDITAIAADSRLDTIAATAGGKFVLVLGGEVSVSHPQVDVAWSSSAATIAAGALSAARIDRALMHLKFRSVMSPSAASLTNDQLSTLALKKVNWIGRSTIGERGVPYQTHAKTDNTLTSRNDALWAVSHMRILSKVINNIHAIGSGFIGSIGYPKLQQDVELYLRYLVTDDILKDYNLTIYRKEEDPNTAVVDVNLIIYGTLRELFLSVSVGNKTMVS